MLIDWFTVGAQMFNFVVLVWLLKRFLYTPILGAIDARDARSASQRTDLARDRARVQQEHEELTAKQLAFDTQRAALLATAVAEADREKDRLLAAAQTEMQAVRSKDQASRQQELLDLTQALTRMLTGEVFAICQRALRDLASVELEHSMVALFVAHLGDLTPAIRKSLGDALQTTSAEPILRSRFALTAEDRSLSQEAVDQLGRSPRRLMFENVPESIGGIELLVSGQRASWSIAQYLRSFQEQVTTLLTQATP